LPCARNAHGDPSRASLQPLAPVPEDSLPRVGRVAQLGRRPSGAGWGESQSAARPPTQLPTRGESRRSTPS
jgi:hypothetical protein